MKILILGAGFMQLNTIKKTKEKGHEVIVSDYLPDAPGRAIADYSEMVSTFDIPGNIGVAQKYGVDAVFTIGTDQPVLTAAIVAQELNLPRMISTKTALKVTNKKYMKEVFANNDIPSSRYMLIGKKDLLSIRHLRAKLRDLNFPAVLKPLDSQGQRGVFKIRHPDQDILGFIHKTFSFTNQREIIVEEFTAGDEITVSAWVENRQPHILMVTDRPLLDVEPHLGTPDGHIFPSRYLHSHYSLIKKVTDQVVDAFNIAMGPVYLQMIINKTAISVIEVACRIGGGHEEELIPLVTGIDLLDIFIERSIGRDADLGRIFDYDLLKNEKKAMVKFLIARQGHAKGVDLRGVLDLEGVVNAGFYKPNGQVVKKMTDSTCRSGYLLVEGENYRNLMHNMRAAQKTVKIFNETGENLICTDYEKEVDEKYA